jgi:hypothetical protein
MPLLLHTVREHRWYKADAAPFLAVDDVPADSVCDLSPSENLLSVWEVAEDRSNIERIVRAVAAGRGNLSNMGYVLFDSAHLPAVGIEAVPNKGKSPDDGANPWHRDLVVSGKKVVALTRIILQTEIEGGNSGTILKARLKELIAQGIQNGELPESVKKLLK